mgnify:FL=1
MQVIWKFKRPVSRMEIEQALQSEKNWSTNTVLTLLTRLERKGFIKRIKDGKAFLHQAIVDEQTYLVNESSTLLGQLFRGNPVNFIAALHSAKKLTEEDLQELEEYINSLKIETSKENSE